MLLGGPRKLSRAPGGRADESGGNRAKLGGPEVPWSAGGASEAAYMWVLNDTDTSGVIAVCSEVRGVETIGGDDNDEDEDEDTNTMGGS